MGCIAVYVNPLHKKAHSDFAGFGLNREGYIQVQLHPGMPYSHPSEMQEDKVMVIVVTLSCH